MPKKPQTHLLGLSNHQLGPFSSIVAIDQGRISTLDHSTPKLISFQAREVAADRNEPKKTENCLFMVFGTIYPHPLHPAPVRFYDNGPCISIWPKKFKKPRERKRKTKREETTGPLVFAGSRGIKLGGCRYCLGGGGGWGVHRGAMGNRGHAGRAGRGGRSTPPCTCASI